MFNPNVSFRKANSSKTSSRFLSVFLASSLCFAALFNQTPVFATDPIEADPDPDTLTSSIVTLVVDDLADVDPRTLPPGRYLIIVVNPKGPDQTFEILVP